MSKMIYQWRDEEGCELRVCPYGDTPYFVVVSVDETNSQLELEPGYGICGLTFEQATEMHRRLGEALTDERVRRAEAERSKQP